MDTNKLRTALEIIKEDFEKNNLRESLQSFQSLLQQSISKSTPETAKAFKDEHNRITGLLNSCKSNDVRPSYRKIFDKIGASNKTGIELRNRISHIINKNTITPADALTKITNLNKGIDDFYNHLNVLIEKLELLNIKPDGLKGNEAEIGILIPPKIIDSNIRGLEKELHKIDFAFKTFKEVAGDDITSINIRTISSSDFQFYLVALPSVAVCIAATLDRLVSFYKNLLEIKKLHKELGDKSLPKKVTQPLEAHIKEQTIAELEKIAIEITDKYYKDGDKGRKNELKVAMTTALRYLANRLDNGAIIEVEVGEPDKPKEPDKTKTNDAKEIEEIDKQYAQALEKYEKAKGPVLEMNKQGRIISFLISQSHPILFLPDVEIDTNSESEKNSKAQKK